ncbi:hypothetical protein [Infirmifilum sp.]|uniref:hypothetical protein n=1 Tax=Infirmifilum sp. TaxID=2856575 RepID=UPI003D145C78
MNMNLGIYVREIIDRYNLEEPKNPNANVDDLILVDNVATETLKLHAWNVTVAIITGHWGSGKTYSALKLFHDLKNSAYVTYVPARYAKGLAPQTKVDNVRSTVATIIAKALSQPRTLSNEVAGVITNVNSDINMPIDRELSEFLEDYYLKLREMNAKHLLLLDELEEAIRAEEDLTALIYTMRILRKLFDQYGAARLTVACFVAPFQPGTRAFTVAGTSKLTDYIKYRLSRLEAEARYVLDKTALIEIDEMGITKEILRGMFTKSIEVIKKEVRKRLNLELDVDLRNADSAIDLIAKSSKWIRFGRDLLIDVISNVMNQYAKKTNKYISISADCKSVAEEVIKEILGLKKFETKLGIGLDLKEILVSGRLTKIPMDLKFAGEVIEKVLADALRDKRASFYKLGERSQIGFRSITYLVVVRSQERKGRETIERSLEIPITFWFRFTDVNPGTVAMANKVFSNKNVLIITTENTKFELRRAEGPRSFSLLGIIRLPPEIAYYIIAGSAIFSEKIREGLQKRFEQEYAPKIVESIRQVPGLE